MKRSVAGTYGNVVPRGDGYVDKQFKAMRSHELASDCWHGLREFLVYRALHDSGLDDVSPKVTGMTASSVVSLPPFLTLTLKEHMPLERAVIDPKTTSQCVTGWAFQLFEAVAAWTAAGLYHCDIKHPNCVVDTARNRLLVVDWGLVRTDAHKLSALDVELTYSSVFRLPTLRSTTRDLVGAELWAAARTVCWMFGLTPQDVVGGDPTSVWCPVLFEGKHTKMAPGPVTYYLPPLLQDLLQDVFNARVTTAEGLWAHGFMQSQAPHRCQSLLPETRKERMFRAPVLYCQYPRRRTVLQVAFDVAVQLGVVPVFGVAVAFLDSLETLPSMSVAKMIRTILGAVLLASQLVREGRPLTTRACFSEYVSQVPEPYSAAQLVVDCLGVMEVVLDNNILQLVIGNPLQLTAAALGYEAFSDGPSVILLAAVYASLGCPAEPRVIRDRFLEVVTDWEHSWPRKHFPASYASEDVHVEAVAARVIDSARQSWAEVHFLDRIAPDVFS